MENTLIDEDYRICTKCGKKHSEGYFVEYDEYYCSDECLNDEYTAEEYIKMYEDGYAYWTQWY